mgnify:CR=1 FL=1
MKRWFRLRIWPISTTIGRLAWTVIFFAIAFVLAAMLQCHALAYSSYLEALDGWGTYVHGAMTCSDIEEIDHAVKSVAPDAAVLSVVYGSIESLSCSEKTIVADKTNSQILCFQVTGWTGAKDVRYPWIAGSDIIEGSLSTVGAVIDKDLADSLGAAVGSSLQVTVSVVGSSRALRKFQETVEVTAIVSKTNRFSGVCVALPEVFEYLVEERGIAATDLFVCDVAGDVAKALAEDLRANPALDDSVMTTSAEVSKAFWPSIESDELTQHIKGEVLYQFGSGLFIAILALYALYDARCFGRRAAGGGITPNQMVLPFSLEAVLVVAACYGLAIPLATSIIEGMGSTYSAYTEPAVASMLLPFGCVLGVTIVLRVGMLWVKARKSE